MFRPASIDSKTQRGHAAPEALQLCTPTQARTLLQPLRVELLRLLAQPRGIRELAEAQMVHYHVKALEAAGLVRAVEQRRVRALTETLYQAAAETLAPSAELLGMLGGRRASGDALSKGYLLALAEELAADAARLALSRETDGAEHPTLSLAAQVELGDPSRREQFAAEVQAALTAIAAKYGAAEPGAEANGQIYKLVLACYPAPVGAPKERAEP
jgi:DNA-binding transcriptional ArsR family regulator